MPNDENHDRKVSPKKEHCKTTMRPLISRISKFQIRQLMKVSCRRRVAFIVHVTRRQGSQSLCLTDTAENTEQEEEE